MRSEFDCHKAILNTWKTNNRTTIFLIENISKDLWNEKVPGSPLRTVGTIAGHVHNTRCMWIKMIGKGQTVKVPVRVDPHHADRKKVIEALSRSNKTMLDLLKACIDNGGKLPSTPAWLNFPNDIVHFLAYFIAHESHHRGQIIMLARQIGRRLPTEVSGGVWQWKKRLKEAK